MKLNAKVTALRTNDRMELTITTSATGLEQTIVADNDGYALDDELVVLVLTKGQAVELHKAITTPIKQWDDLTIKTADLLVDQLRPDPPVPSEPPPWESGKPRCAFACRAGDDDGFDHQCLFPHGHTEPHTYSASCVLQRIAPDEATTQEFRLGGTA